MFEHLPIVIQVGLWLGLAAWFVAIFSLLANGSRYLKALTTLAEARTANVEADTDSLLNSGDDEELDEELDEDPDFNPYEQDRQEGLGENTTIDHMSLLRLAMLLRAARQAHEQTQTGVQEAKPATESVPDPETAEVSAGVTCAACGTAGTTGPVEEPVTEPTPEAVPDATGDSTDHPADEGSPVG